jgi:ADP-ribose pyrophosphatase
VDIIAIVRKDGEEDRIVIISQFRPPTEKVCLEIPSGWHHIHTHTSYAHVCKSGGCGVVRLTVTISCTLALSLGLVDAGETAEQAALRELKEETGYIGK